jgi:phosphoribosylamine--glycine ligase
MKVLLIGSGGREHALAWKLSQSPALDRLVIAPGNPGTACYGQNTSIPLHDLAALADLARHEAVDLVVVGPENPLAAGLADRCQDAGIPVFGPTAGAARIESSKSFAKALMNEANVPTAETHTFSDPVAAAEFARRSGKAWVVKADGLALGKGVVVADDLSSTLEAVAHVGTIYTGQPILLEERLYGRELSVLALCDGQRLLPLPPARDHKRLLDGDAGPNTGGVGAVAPVESVTPDLLDDIVSRCMQPVVDVLADRGTPFCGALYAGLMLTNQGPKVLEFNARFGDPEIQVVLPLLEGDLLAAMLACAEGRLQTDLLTIRQGCAACVVLTAAGYPEQPRKGDPITGLETLKADDLLIFHAGTAWEDNRLVTAGGRVLGVTGLGSHLRVALDRAYAAISQISFTGMHYRIDIGA